MNQGLQNPSPKIHELLTLTTSEINKRKQLQLNQEIDDEFDELQVFELIRNINDPQHPLTLQQLNVVSLQNCTIHTVELKDNQNIQYLTIVDVKFTPTIPHCSMAQMIGLMIKVKLMKFLPKKMKIKVSITEGSHANEKDITKQINDKQRVSAALQNQNIGAILQRGFNGSDRFDFANFY